MGAVLRPRHLVLAGMLVAVGEAVAGGLLVAALGPADIALFFLVSGALTAAISAALRPLLAPRRPPDAGPDGSDQDGPDGPSPPWWPSFEREFAEHVRGAHSPARVS